MFELPKEPLSSEIVYDRYGFEWAYQPSEGVWTHTDMDGTTRLSWSKLLITCGPLYLEPPVREGDIIDFENLTGQSPGTVAITEDGETAFIVTSHGVMRSGVAGGITYYGLPLTVVHVP